MSTDTTADTVAGTAAKTAAKTAAETVANTAPETHEAAVAEATTGEEIDLVGDDGTRSYALRWLPSGPARGIVALAHGMGEHIRRYETVARALTTAGYAVYGKDHRGHGRTAGPDHLGDVGVDGWNLNLGDMRTLIELARSAHPGAPTILLGHSMGAMLSQQFIYRYGYLLDGIALSGSPGFAHPVLSLIPRVLALFERWRHGHAGESELLQDTLFGKSNEPFDEPDATGFEWLSRDPAEVQKYVDDPECGFVLRAGSLVELFSGAREATRRGNLATIPKTLPIYVFSGAEDPVHGEQANLNRMVSAYRSYGLNLDLKVYPGGRHELFNETNQDEVLTDLTAWLDQVVAGAVRTPAG
ncbi:MAG: lysophospholipase [Pseudomonadota bacterium]